MFKSLLDVMTPTTLPRNPMEPSMRDCIDIITGDKTVKDVLKKNQRHSPFEDLLPIPNPARALSKSFTDNVLKDKVTPRVGSVVYCDLAFGAAEHSGIYIGGNRIVHLNRHGRIEIVTPDEFISGTPAISIYVSSSDGEAVGSMSVADRARSMVGKNRSYNVILDNCHQFSTGCVIGDFESANNFLWMLKFETEKHLGANDWLVWDR